MQDPLNSSITLLYKDIKPSDYNLNNPSLTQDYNVNMSGGNDKGTYYAGLGYNKSEGLPISSFYERYSFIFNGSYKLADWITANSNFNYNRANWRSMPGSQDNEGNYFGRIMSLPPLFDMKMKMEILSSALIIAMETSRINPKNGL